MTVTIVCPLAGGAELAVRHRASHMVSLMAEGHDFHRPGIVPAERHLTLRMNDIAFAGTGDLIAPAEGHVGQLIDFARRRSEEHTSELQSIMRISYAVFCLKNKKQNTYSTTRNDEEQ